MLANIDLFYFCSFIFKKIMASFKKATRQKKCYDWYRWYWKLEDSPRLKLINEECANLILANDGGELTRNINQKKKSSVLQKPIDVHSVTNNVGQSIYSVTMWNIYCGSVR